MQLAVETEGLSGFEYVLEIGFVVTLTEAALDTVLVNPEVNIVAGFNTHYSSM